MSNSLSEGVTIQLGQSQTAKSSTLAFLQGDPSVVPVNWFEGRGNARTPPFVTDWVSYPLTLPTIGMVADQTNEVQLNNVGAMIGRICVQIDFPPICNTLTNAQWDGTSLASVTTAVATVGEFSGGTLTPSSNAFAVGDEVTLSGGTGFAGVVSEVDSDERPTAITVIDGGSGYAINTNYTLTGPTGSLTQVQVTVGRALTHFPSVGGRMLIPRCQNTHGFFTHVSDNVTDATNRNAIKNCVIAEDYAVSAKAMTGITVTDTHHSVRVGGLSSLCMAAYYCRAAPIYLIREAHWKIGSADAEVFPPLTTQAIYDYHTFMYSDFNRASDVSLHMDDSPYNLKVLSSGGNSRWIVPLPFPSCHSRSMFVPKFDVKYHLAVTWNDWRDTIVNSPTPTGLSCTLNASPVTTTAPSGASFPAGTTYTPVLATYTVSGGRLTDTATGARRSSLLTATSATTTVVPSEPLSNTHFQASLLVEHIRMSPENETYVRTKFKSTRLVCVHRQLSGGLATPANYATSFNAETKKKITGMNGPVAFMLVRGQMASRAKVNMPLDFSSPRDGVLQTSLPSTVGNAAGGQLAPPQPAFRNVSFFLNNSLRFSASEASRIMAFRSSGLREPRGHTDEVVLVPFTATNPFDGVMSGVFTPEKTLSAEMVYDVNPAVFADLQFAGGLPVESSMTVRLDYVAYAVMTVDASTATIGLSATS
jgi:hypothetical protein